MSDDVNIIEKPRDKNKQRDFVQRRVLRRKANVRPTFTNALFVNPAPVVDAAAAAYAAAATKAQPVFDAADRILAGQLPRTREISAAEPNYVAASTTLGAALQRPNNYAQALLDLQTKELAAKAVLAARGRDQAEGLKRAQLDQQMDAYDAMAPALADVRRTYLPQGGAQRIAKADGKSEPEFTAFLSTLQTLEDAKRNIDPAQPVAAAQARAIQKECDAVVTAAQAYLAHFEADLTDQQKNDKAFLSRKARCEESVIQARHYGIAMELDAAGRPSDTNPWDAQTQLRVAGAQTAFNFEKGGQVATSTKGGGASDAFWIRTKNAAETATDLQAGQPASQGRRMQIFKPAEGESFPDGVNDRKGAGAAKEALAFANAKLFGAQTGIDLGVPPTAVVSVGQHALEGGDPAGPAKIGSAQQLAAQATEFRELPANILAQVKTEDIHKIALMDIMSLAVDRHGGNIMVEASDPANPNLVPIDHGGTLPSRADFSEAKQRMAGFNYSDLSGASTQNVLMSVPAAFQKMDPEMVAKLGLLDPDAMEQGMKDQRNALGAVHPELDPATKVGDDSFHMSKRAMMFLKAAADTLSPAEIQIALTARGEDLFDVDDQHFDALAQQVIAEQAPKKDAYQEMMTLPGQDQSKILRWLEASGWTMPNERGQISPAEFVMRDPVNALKLYKSQTTNPNPVTVPPVAARPLPAAATAVPDQPTQNAIIQAFPKLKPSTDQAQLKRRVALWNEFNALGGVAAFQAALDATGCDREEETLSTAVQALSAWRDLQQPANAAALAALVPGSSSKNMLYALENALQVPARKQAAAQLLTLADTAGNAIAPDAALASSVQMLIAETKAATGPMADQASAQILNAQADAAGAKAAQGDPAGAEKDAQATLVAARKAAVDEFSLPAIALADQLLLLAPTLLWQSDAAEAETLGKIRKRRAEAPLEYDVAFARQRLADLQAFQVLMQNLQPKPIAVVQPVAPVQGPGAQPTVAMPPLAQFTWSQSDASAVKKRAVAGGLFKDQDTGMTAALKAVNEAQANVKAMNMKANLANDKKIAVLQKAVAAYDLFGRFVAGKLRLLSAHTSWSGYCDTAMDAVETGLLQTRQRIAGIQQGTGT
jgi:hypothetical protein